MTAKAHLRAGSFSSEAKQQSENFVVHFTTSTVDSQLVNGQMLSLQSNAGYAQSILDHLESSLAIFLQDGWESLPTDCDESITDLESPNHCVNFGGNSYT